MSSGSGAASKLELGNLKSYSPSWPFPVRLTLAIAVQYACLRCVQRAEAIHRLLDTSSTQADLMTQEQLDYDNDLVERDEDGQVISRLEGWNRKMRIRRDGELVMAWKEYCDKFITATCQHLGVPEESLPPGPTTLEDIRSASRGRLVNAAREVDAPQYEMGTSHASASHEGTGRRAEEIKRREKEDISASKEDTSASKIATENQEEAIEEDLDVDSSEAKRSGGALDDAQFRQREIELANELLLVALGLGQHRAEDGSTTLFEQDAIFGEVGGTTIGPQKSHAMDNAKLKADVQSLAPKSTTPAASNVGAKFWQTAASSLGRSSFTRGQAEEKKPRSALPTKPNEPCHYDARARAIIFVAITAMGVAGLDISMAEKVMAQTIYFILSEGLLESRKQGKGDPLQEEESSRQSWMNQSSQTAVAREKSKVNWGRYIATGAGVAVGGAIIGLTGGLAAPLIAPALVGLTGSAFLATTGGIVMIGTLLGVTGGGLAGYKVQRRLRGIDHFEFKEVNSTAREAGVAIPSLHATICCSGLLLKTDAQGAAFDHIFHNTSDARDVYTIQSEEKTMQEAGEGLKGYVIDTAIRTGGRKVGEEVIKHTALAGLAALALPLTIWGAASAALDSVFVQAKSRSYRAGLILADVLRDQVQGHRPVTLIGTSIGCVTILTALGELAKMPEENMHIVDSVYLIGAPITPSPGTLRRARSITARRFVNAYTRDMVCSIAAWLGSGISLEELRGGLMPRVMGSQPVLSVPGVENIDVGDLTAEGHFSLNRPSTLEAVLKRCRAME